MSVLDHSVTLSIPDPTPPGIEPADPNRVKLFRLAGNGPGMRAHYARRMKERAWEQLDELEGIVTLTRFEALQVSLMRDISAGLYDYGEEIHNKIDGGRTGFLTSLTARIRVTDPTFSERIWIEKIIEAYGVDRLIALMRQADGPPVPNGPAPQAAGQVEAQAPTMTKN